MDWFFNWQIPRNTDTTYIIRPAQKTFVTGICLKYSDAYFRDAVALKGRISFDEFTYMMGHLNDTLRAYWPCNCTIYFGYILAPFTLGLSFLLPNLCISDAKDALIRSIARQNRLKLTEKGLEMRYVQGYCTSWIEIRVIEKPQS